MLSVRTSMLVMAIALAASGAANADFGARHHGPGRGGLSLEGVLARAVEKLNLDSSQQQQLNVALKQAESGREAIRANVQRLKQTADAELANPAPNLAKIATVADEVQGLNHQIRLEARKQWLLLYSMLNSSQQTTVGDLLRAKRDRVAARRERLREHFQH